MPEISLPFNLEKQRAILGHILTDEKFFRSVRSHIKPHWFTQELINGKIYSVQLAWWDERGHFPTIEELLGSTAIGSETAAEQGKLRKQVELCLLARANFNLDSLRQDLTLWLHSIIYRESIERAESFYNRQDWRSVAGLFDETAKVAKSVTFEDYGVSDFNDLDSIIKQEQRGRAEALTTGLQLFDRALLDGATVGGLQKGDTTVMMAPSNVGKTTTLITMAMANVRLGKKVLFMTHEGRPADIKLKMLQNLMFATKMELMSAYDDPALRQRFFRLKDLLNEHLVYIPYNRPGMTVEQVASVIYRAQDDCLAKHGRGFDLMVSDYPAKLSTDRAGKGNLPRREIDRIVYDYYVQMALDMEWHSLLAIQTNREGSRVNNGKEDRLLTKEDVSESWGVMEIATNVVTINRPPKAIAENWLTYYVTKTRSSETGTAIVCRTDYTKATTHSEKLGGITYKDWTTMEDRVDSLLQQHLGGAVPEHLVYETSGET